jgi:hypothetical protein
MFRLPDGRVTRIWWKDGGPAAQPHERVPTGFLKEATLTLRASSVQDAPGSLNVYGVLADSSGAPLGGAPIELGLYRSRGLGAWGVYRRSGTVPAGASRASLGVRVNTECDCAGASEIAFQEVLYQETAAIGQSGPRPGVRVRRTPTDFPGAPVVDDAPGEPRGAAVLLTVPATGSALLNSSAFPVRAGSQYDLRITASVSPASVGTGYFAIIFLHELEILRETIPFKAAPLGRATATTSPDGRFETTLRDVPDAPVRVTARYRGDAGHWPARAGLVLDR